MTITDIMVVRPLREANQDSIFLVLMVLYGRLRYSPILPRLWSPVGFLKANEAFNLPFFDDATFSNFDHEAHWSFLLDTVGESSRAFLTSREHSRISSVSVGEALRRRARILSVTAHDHRRRFQSR